MPRKLFTSRCHAAIGSEAHVAAYKRPPLYKSVTESHPRVTESTHHNPHHHKQNSISLSNAVRSNSEFIRKTQEHQQTLAIYRIEIQCENQWNSLKFSEIRIESSSSNLCCSQFKARTRHWWTASFNADHERKRKEKKKFQANPGQWRERREKLPVKFEFKPRISETEPQPKDFRRIWLKISKNSGKLLKPYLHIIITSEETDQRKSMDIWTVLIQQKRLWNPKKRKYARNAKDSQRV